VVVSIIAVLASMLLPALARARDAAKTTLCTNNERQLYLAWASYGDDFDGRLPAYHTSVWGGVTPANAWTVIMAEQLQPAVILVGTSYWIVWKSFLACPNLRATIAANGRQGNLYPAYGMNTFGIGGSTVNGAKIYRTYSQVADPARLVGFGDSNLASSGAPNLGYYSKGRDLNITDLRHAGRANNTLFCDGHVELKKADFFNPAWGWWNLAPWGNP